MLGCNEAWDAGDVAVASVKLWFPRSAGADACEAKDSAFTGTPNSKKLVAVLVLNADAFTSTRCMHRVMSAKG